MTTYVQEFNSVNITKMSKTEEALNRYNKAPTVAF